MIAASAVGMPMYSWLIDDARLELAAGAQGVQGRDGRLGQAHVLLEIPDVLVLAAFDAEVLPQIEFEDADLLHVVSG